MAVSPGRAAAVLPPSDEGGGKPEGLDGGRDKAGLLRNGMCRAYGLRALSLSRLRRQLPRQREPRGRAMPAGRPLKGSQGGGLCLSSPVPRRSCLPLTREVASPQGLTEGEIRRACCETGCAEHTGCERSPSVACGDSSLVRGSQEGRA